MFRSKLTINKFESEYVVLFPFIYVSDVAVYMAKQVVLFLEVC